MTSVIGAGLLIAALSGGIASAGTPGTSGDPRATAFPGNITTCPAGSTPLLVVNGASNGAGGGVTGTISGANKQFLTLTFNSSLTGAGIDVFIKGGTFYNEYEVVVGTTDTTLMHGPFNSGGNIPTISHYLVCQDSTPPPPPQSPTFSVFFGYTDTYRGSGFGGVTNPSPWAGDPGVIFEGCNVSNNCPLQPDGVTPAYDAGAVRIQNTGTVDFTITPESVVIGSCTFTPWSTLGAITVPVGDTLILTQTGGTTAPACENGLIIPPGAFYNLDTSESNGTGTCVPDGLIPQVNVLLNGTATSFNDTAMVLNTGGVDGGICGAPGANESHDWTPAGP